MTMPMRERIWNAKDATATAALSARGQTSLALRPIIEAVTAGFTGTLDIQGRVTADGAWVNIPYSVFSAGWGAPSVAQVSFTTNSASHRYRILDYWPEMQIVMDRSAGTITADWAAAPMGDQSRYSIAADTELPAAAALADNTANPTAPAVGSFGHVWDGAFWDRAAGDSANGTDVDVTRLPTQGYSAEVSVTRTNDTNVYAANDVIGAATGSTAALTFASMGPSAGRIMITSAELEIDITAVISGMTSFRLHLYNVTPPSALGDNTAFDLPSGDRASYLGFIELGAPVDLGSTLYVAQDALNKQRTLAGTSLFGYLVTVGAYTPAASSVFKVTLHSVAV